MHQAAPRTRVGRLHVITDVALQRRHDHAALARLALEGGADVIQLRDKGAPDPAWLRAQAERIARACEEADARCIINDRVELALEAGAHGAHVGHGDASPGEARARLGRAAIVGATANSLDEARAALAHPIDYLGVGPVYGTRSKASPAPTLGLEGLARIVELAGEVPVIAIGGITVERVREVMQAGAAGIAVLSAVACAAEPRSATEAFVAAMRRERWVD